MRNYVKTFQCNSTYKAIYKVLLKYYHRVENTFLRQPFLSVNSMKRRQASYCFLMESNTCFMAFHVAQMKYVNFLHRLILHTANAHAHVSPQS